MSKDRQQLREARKESSKLRKRITGTSDAGLKRKSRKGRKKRFVIDEDAFYAGKKMTSSKTKKTSKDDEFSLAKKLGLDIDTLEQAKKMQAQKNKKKKTKAELEQEVSCF